MCGIVGTLDFDAGASCDRMREALECMSARLRHRGPDGQGLWVEGPVGLAHRRLAIIDLHERADQPMHSPDGRLHVVFNGEIYNFQDLRRELEQHGHRFETRSDTEVLLHGYRQWGDELPRRLRGMFAFAIYDSEKRSLFLARDRFGKKPLVYAWHGSRFLFASEAKSILEWPGFSRDADPAVIHDYLSFGYTPGEQTAFLGLNRLPPAHHMTVDAHHGSGNPPSIQRYWRLAPIDDAKTDMTVEAAAGELLERFDEALKVRLIADVPLGAFLSGGVDSSTVVARMSAMVSEPVKTFSVGFEAGDFDETPYAIEVAERYGCDHRSFKMDYSLVDLLPDMIWHYGEPYSDSSALVSMALSREIRKHVKVALTGDGGDETLLGYSRYDRWRGQVMRHRSGLPTRQPAVHPDPAFGPPVMRDRYFTFIATFRDLHKQWGYGPALLDHNLTPSADRLPLFLEAAREENAMDLAARAEVETYLPDDLLIKADIATMAASVEGRSPFLDHELADWIASLPQSLRVFDRGGKTEMKALLKKAMEPQLGDDILYRKKRGFSVPVKHWLRHELRDLTADLLTSKSFEDRGYFRPRYIRTMLDDHFEGREENGTRLWNLLCLELWHRTFLDSARDAPLSLSIGTDDTGVVERKLAS